MSDEIVVAGFQPKVHLVATKPEQMAVAQADLKLWFLGKTAEVRNEMQDLEHALATAVKNGWATATLKRQVTRVKQRHTFYDKCLKASQAGFTILPNIPVDVFAVRVGKDSPDWQHREIVTDSQWQRPQLPDEVSDKLPAGEGHYVSNDNLETRGQRNETRDGKQVMVKYVQTADFGEVEFPMIAAAPEVMDATGRAMLLNIFDEIGISPQRAPRKADPLIIGRIVMAKQGWQEKVVSFLIAWHLDLRTL